jgi:outer membrane receptor protein involved in Fe transport
MVARRLFAAALLSVTSPAWSQSLSIEEEREEPAPQPEPKKPAPPPPPAKPPAIVMPVAVSTPLEYPSDAQGEANVTLELTLTAEGMVVKATAIEGDEPFASQAVQAAGAWRFEPATRDGKPIPAKIRFLVRFVPPREVQEPEPEPPPDAAKPAEKPGVAPAKPEAAVPYEIVVVGERAPIRHELSRVEVSRIPGAFDDPFRAIEMLPGVVPIVSGLPYFYVRGAPPGNVGYHFDGIPVPFIYHFAAGPGVFHPAFVERVDLYPGAYPVRYGRFAGAIVAGEMAEPTYRWRGEWSIRLLDSGAMVEAPFAGGRGSAMLAGRYSYTGLMLGLLLSTYDSNADVSVGYWDYQGRVRYDLDADDTLEVLGFGSSDYVSFTEPETVEVSPGRFETHQRKVEAVDVNFHRLDLRWDRRLSDGKWRQALMLGRDRTGFADGQVNVYSYMIGARSELTKQLEPKLKLRAGADLLFEALRQEIGDDDDDFGEEPTRGGTPDPSTPGALPPGSVMMPTTPMQPVDVGPDDEEEESEAEALGFNPKRNDFVLGLYTDVVWDVAPKLQLTPGLRVDLFVTGRHAALGIDPRITAEYQLRDKLKVVHGLALVHQAPSFLGPVPGFKSSLAGGLQSAVQHSAAVKYDLPAGIKSSVAVFQTAFYNMTDLISLIQLEQTADSNDEINSLDDLRSSGHAYGLEVELRRSLARKLGGYFTYTLSRSRRFVRSLSGPATTDRTHVINLGLSYDLGRNWRLGSRWMFYTGIPAQVAYVEAARHPPRTPPFWRLDLKIEKRWYIKRPNRWWGLSFELLNSTLNKEQLEGSCNAYSCEYTELPVPITLPNLTFEGAL